MLLFLTKLAWELVVSSDKPWVQLIRAKYLRGRRFLSSQWAKKNGSWIWQGLVDSVDNLCAGLCYRVGNPTTLRIWDDPWIPSLPGFTPPLDFRRATSPQRVSDLMFAHHTCWDMNIISSLFPYSIIKEILKIIIPTHLEQDQPVWTPSPSGKFTI